MKKKKGIIITAIALGVVLLAVLLIPISYGTFKEGGTQIAATPIYTVVHWKKLTNEKISKHCVQAGDGYRYEKTSYYFYPENSKDYEELWEMELERIAKE